LLAVLVLVSGCGEAEPKSAAATPAETAKALRGAPPKLAALHRQANELLGGTRAEFDARLDELKGYPIVVNKWASWCPPCRAEFPYFQQASLRFGKRVAFLGLDGNDADDDARAFLKRFPVSFPHYRDPDEKIAPTIQAGLAYPTTIFFDKTGELVYAHPGPYNSTAELVADIRRYAL
jgi:thiol-disulfide isomerase/thioredoxin